MDSTQARGILQSAIRHAGDQRRGFASRAPRSSGFRSLELAVADPSKLPATLNVEAAQTTTGGFIYLAGFSSFGGGDVLG
jgi:hypothetical protein